MLDYRLRLEVCLKKMEVSDLFSVFFFFSLFHQRADDEALTRLLQISLSLFSVGLTNTTSISL